MLRCQLIKGPEARFIGHLDLARALERALRRAGLPVAYSEGFNPHPKIAFASALALGTTSEGELVEVTLREPVAAEAFRERLNDQLPAGLRLAAVREVAADGPSLGQALEWAAYLLTVEWEGATPDGPVVSGGPSGDDGHRVAGWTALVEAFLVLENCLVQREGKDGTLKSIDVRSLVGRLSVLEEQGEAATLYALVRGGSRANCRPEELVRALSSVAGAGLTARSVHRLGLYAGGTAGPRPLFGV